MVFRILVTVLATLVAATSLTAQRIVDATNSPVAGSAGPATASVTRDERGRATVRAVRLTEPLRLDGRLDEEISGNASASYGSFYGGTRTTASYNGRVGFSPHFAAEPTLTLNWVTLPYGDFTARLVGTRVVVSPSPRLAFSSLTQFNPGAHSLTSSVRMRWEYTPGSDLYVVYSDGRDTATTRFPALQNRSVAIKATRLFRF
jgi:hypothetical protein